MPEVTRTGPFTCSESETIDDTPLAELTIIESLTVSSERTVINTSVIDPPPVGMRAEIINTNLDLVNVGSTTIENSDPVGEDLTQDNEIEQTLALQNTATADNSGIVIADAEGIRARSSTRSWNS